MKIKFFIFVFSSVLLSIGIPLSLYSYPYSQNTYRFRTLSPKGGFYYDGVSDIIQDDEGFIWVSLENDLQRFDGYEYVKYSSHFKNLDVQTTCLFYNIAKDHRGRLYVSTNNGLFKYNKPSDSFRKIADGDIYRSAIDDRDNIWYTSKGMPYGIRNDEHDPKLFLYKQKPIENIIDIQAGKSGVYFASYPNGIYYRGYDNNGEISLLHLLPPDHNIEGIGIENGYLWILTRNHGILKLNISSQEIEDRLQFRDRNENIPLHTFYVDKNGKLWIGTQKGLYIADPLTRESRLYLHSGYDRFSLPNDSVWIITGDDCGNVWIGTYAGGLCYVNLDESDAFTTYTPSQSSLNHNLVSCFAEDGNLLWLGTEGGGLNCLDQNTGKFSFYTHSENSNSLSYNNVKSLAIDSRQRLWIAMYRGGLNCFDKKTKIFTRYLNDPGNRESLYSNNLRKILSAGDSGLWIVYQTNRFLVSFLSFESGKFTHYTFDENAYIFDIQKDNNGHLWIITHTGLYKMDVENRIIENVSPSRNLNAQSLCVDADNNIWIGTIGYGLIKYDVSSSELTFSHDILDFNTSAIYSMCIDDVGYLWLGTDYGLFRYSPENNSYHRFDENDGLQGDVYYPLASFKSRTGNLYFGGSNGFTIIDPQDIKLNSFRPKVIISDFYIDNVPVTSESGAYIHGDEIILNHNQANFGFRFSSDNYLSPYKNTFRYRLWGYDDRWIAADAFSRTAMYSKVPPGTYYFEILAANNDGVWGDTATMKIIRKPAPWVSWPAFLLYCAILLGIVSTFLYYYNEKRKLKLQLYMDGLDKLKKEEIHQSQLRFFTNISHDFRTPLSLILSSIDNLKQEGLKGQYYRILNNNARRLLNLVNELMDFRTLEHGKMRLRVQLLDIDGLITGLSSDFADYARKRNIKFEIACDSGMSDKIYADKQIVEKVVMNLLNNAFKYTKDGGRIVIETYSDPCAFVSEYNHNHNITEGRIPENAFLLVVRDTGVGISGDSIKTVFERFYKVNTANLNEHLGTGLGLALVKNLVLLHKGTVTIFSEHGKGTDIAVYFPADGSVYEESEFAEEYAEEPTGEKLAAAYNADNPDNMEDVFRRDKKRILIVEDNDDLKLLLSNFLSRHYETIAVANGMEASDTLGKTDVDLILSDIMMPLKNGIELLREVKEDVNTSHIPFILLTAKTGLESRIEGTGSGADIYFEKPVDLNLLLLSIRNLFTQQQNLREYYAKNYYVDSAELFANEQDNIFLSKLIEIIDDNLDQPNIDVHYIASELSMSRSKLYSKVKTLTDKSIVEFILNYRLRKAARMIIERDMSMSQVMNEIGIKSQSYFTRAFKNEFGEPPTVFAIKHRRK